MKHLAAFSSYEHGLQPRQAPQQLAAVQLAFKLVVAMRGVRSLTHIWQVTALPQVQGWLIRHWLPARSTWRHVLNLKAMFNARNST